MGSLAHVKLASLATSLKAKRLMALSLGATRVVISSHPETAREILFGSSFSDRPIKESARLLMFERAIGFAPSGTYWKKLRRIAAFNMFSPRRILGLESLRQRVADEMVVRIWKEMEKKGVVEVRGILQEGSFSNILESVFGSISNFNCLSLGGSEELGNMVKEGYELIAKFNLEDYFPFKFLDFYGVKRKCHKLAAKVTSVVGQMVEERKRAQDLLIGENDFLSTLLSLPKEERLGNDISRNRYGCYTLGMDHGKDAGTTAMVNMWAISHDSSIWEDPLTFKPERFLKEDVSIMGSDLRLAPFGAGRRVCPGRALGLATVHLWLAQLLHNFVWLPIQPVDLSESLKLSLEMKNPLRCSVIGRNALNPII
ncbi:hypothetical protein TSUD_67620 [Trifolium subterraneum]|uniref:Cytochrome P450 n=1 Tax=Trifolium subterraneum TaxID=3900 RepID=A0A2Z6N2B1_TRISU|nr:hypothetical protein TSUD_67620 [Trifolium subterraneum]